jgi:arylsulfatase
MTCSNLLGTTLRFGLFLCLVLASLRASAQNKLPLPDPEFKGRIGATYEDSEADTGMFKSPTAPEGAPNVLLVLIDDAGFGATSTFGGPCNTPTLDHLAANGLRYNRFHTTSLCSPTRAALLTGRNHHSAATGQIMELANGYPGYTGVIPQSTATISKILQDNGYSTAWIGKNHNVPDFTVNNVGPFTHWPNAMGFDYFYGFLGGEMDQWYPALFENQNVVKNLPTPEEGYNLQVDQTDKAIQWMRNQNSIAPDRPFFLYYATGAVHAPHHVPQEWVEKYRGEFAHGFDKQREITFQRQKELGVIPQDAKLTPRMKQVPGWDSYDADTHKIFERQMETYAGYYEYADHQIGRIIDAIEETGELDNTLIIYIAGDNGGSAEGGFIGIANEVQGLNGIPATTETNQRYFDQWGSPETSPHYGVGWAWAMDTPFSWTKQMASYLGGTRNPMVVSWPAKIKDKGGLRSQYHHVNDIAPTLLEVIGIEEPDEVNGIKQKPMEGVSFAYTFASGTETAAERKTTQYYELFGNRAIYHDGWMASVMHKVPWDISSTVPFDQDKWELFHLAEDFSQAEDLAKQYPEKLKELQAVFDQEAKKFGVFPLDDRFAQRMDTTLRPSFTAGRYELVFYEGMEGLGEGSAPNTKNKSHTITTDVVIPEEGAEGVLLAFGGGTGGFVLYVQDNKFTYYYDYFGAADYKIESTSLPTGKVKLKMDFKYDGGGVGKGGTATLYVNDKKAGEGRVEKTVPARFGTDGMDIGKDLHAPVNHKDYKRPYPFTGEIERVRFELK